MLCRRKSDNLDGLNYLAGKTVDFINKCAMNGTILAHVDGGVPNIRIDMDAIDELSLGELFYKFEFACGVSGYVLGVNPFNQPGVESYKKNMFALLGKPGYEEKTAELKSKTWKVNINYGDRKPRGTECYSARDLFPLICQSILFIGGYIWKKDLS